jgi:hypothetical protein
MICSRCKEQEAVSNFPYYNWPKANMKTGQIQVATKGPLCRRCFEIEAHKQIVNHIRYEAYIAFSKREPVTVCEEILGYEEIWLNAYLEAFDYEHERKKRILKREFNGRNLSRWFD